MSLQLEKLLGLISMGAKCPCSVLSRKGDGVTLVHFAGSTQCYFFLSLILIFSSLFSTCCWYFQSSVSQVSYHFFTMIEDPELLWDPEFN